MRICKPSQSELLLHQRVTDNQSGSNHPQQVFADRWADTVWIPFSPPAVNNNLKKGLGLITQSLPGWGQETAVSMYADGRPPLVLVKQAEYIRVIQESTLDFSHAWIPSEKGPGLYESIFIARGSNFWLHVLKVKHFFFVLAFIHSENFTKIFFPKTACAVLFYVTIDVTSKHTGRPFIIEKIDL